MRVCPIAPYVTKSNKTIHQVMHGAAPAVDINGDIQMGSSLLADPQFPEKTAEVKVLNEEFGDKPRRGLWVEMKIAGNSGLLVGCLQVVRR